ncbi:MAG TPA: cupin domain-containing protein [Anaerolineae bacterium]
MNEKEAIEVFPADRPPGLVPHGDIIEAAFIKGNMGGLVVVKLHAGELAEHSHEQEHVGVVLEGSFEFVSGERVVRLQAGQMYRIPPHVPHAVRCREYALIIQARA